MEAFETQCGSIDGVRIDFGRFVRAVEISCEKTLLNKKNQILLRQKMKQEWLYRSKIIPPSFPTLSHLHTSPNITIHLSPIGATTSPMPCEQARRNSKTAHRQLRKAASCERVRASWKLEWRRDELNILRYAKGKEEGQKTMKPRRVNRKFEQLKSEVHSLYKTNLPSQAQEEQFRERLKTMQNCSPRRQRCIV